MENDNLIDALSGPTLEAYISVPAVFRACDLWQILDLARAGVEIRVRCDWNGINARAWDMSFVPWERNHA